MDKAYSSLKKAFDKYNAANDNLTDKLKTKVKFNFYVGVVGSDGLILGDSDTANVAPLDYCMKIINQKGMLTLDDFKNGTI